MGSLQDTGEIEAMAREIMLRSPNYINMETLEKYGQESSDPMHAQIANFFVGFFKWQEKE